MAESQELNSNLNNEKLTQDVSDTIMSPFCPGLTLSACPSPQAKDLKVKINSLFTQGYSKDAVINQLRIAYGENILGVPLKNSTFGVFGSYLPFIFLLLGIFLIILKLRKMKR